MAGARRSTGATGARRCAPGTGGSAAPAGRTRRWPTPPPPPPPGVPASRPPAARDAPPPAARRPAAPCGCRGWNGRRPGRTDHPRRSLPPPRAPAASLIGDPALLRLEQQPGEARHHDEHDPRQRAGITHVEVAPRAVKKEERQENGALLRAAAGRAES